MQLVSHNKQSPKGTPKVKQFFFFQNHLYKHINSHVWIVTQPRQAFHPDN